MFYLTYMLAELRRRSGRTILTALGLALGVGLVVTVTALSTGLDRAQATDPRAAHRRRHRHVGHRDRSTSRRERGRLPAAVARRSVNQLREENGGGRFGLTQPRRARRRSSLATTSSRRPSSPSPRARSTRSQASTASSPCGRWPDPQLRSTSRARSRRSDAEQPRVFEARPRAGRRPGRPEQHRRRRAVSVVGVDETVQELGAITPAQVTAGPLLPLERRTRGRSSTRATRRARTSPSATTLELGGKTFTVVGLAETPLGGQSSDVYVKLSQLQALSDRAGPRQHCLRPRGELRRCRRSREPHRATRRRRVRDDGQDLADRVSGTLVDAKNLAGSLGTALMIVGLLSAFLIASLLTLSSVDEARPRARARSRRSAGRSASSSAR